MVVYSEEANYEIILPYKTRQKANTTYTDTRLHKFYNQGKKTSSIYNK